MYCNIIFYERILYSKNNILQYNFIHPCLELRMAISDAGKRYFGINMGYT